MPDDPDVLINEACVQFKEFNYEAARIGFQNALNISGATKLRYNIALCYFKQKQYAQSLRQIAEIIERGMRDHPELAIGSRSPGRYSSSSVGNSIVLQDACLIEAFNLKFAIEFIMRNFSVCQDVMLEMPPRMESELDPVTLTNIALINCSSSVYSNQLIYPQTSKKEDDGQQLSESTSSSSVESSFHKLAYLLQNPPFPPETFQNLILLHLHHGHHNLAADVLAENSALCYSLLSSDLFDFFDAIVLSQASPQESFNRFDQ